MDSIKFHSADVILFYLTTGGIIVGTVEEENATTVKVFNPSFVIAQQSGQGVQVSFAPIDAPLHTNPIPQPNTRVEVERVAIAYRINVTNSHKELVKTYRGIFSKLDLSAKGFDLNGLQRGVK